MMPTAELPNITEINSNTIRCDQGFFGGNFYTLNSQINCQMKVKVPLKRIRLFILNEI